MSKIDRNFVYALSAPDSDTPTECGTCSSIESHKISQSPGSHIELIENDTDIVYSHDLSGNYTSVNNAAERLMGYSRDELLSMNVKHVVDPAMLEVIDQMMSKKVSGEAAKTA